MTVKLTVKLKESEAQFNRLVQQELRKHLSSLLFAASLNIQTRLRRLVRELITSQPEWASLENGKLAAEFGLDDVNSRLSTILDIWIGSITVGVKPTRTVGAAGISAGLNIQMIKSKWEDVLGSSAAVVTTDKGQELHWLQWLLTEGDKIIVREYDVSYNIPQGMKSRSGQAVMIGKKRGRWRVPPEYSGTTNNNFITRALENIDDPISKIVEQEIKRLT